MLRADVAIATVAARQSAAAVGCEVLIHRVAMSEWELELSFVVAGNNLDIIDMVAITPGLAGEEVLASSQPFTSWAEHEIDDVISGDG